LKSHDAFEYLTVKNLDPKNESDRQLIEEFMLKTYYILNNYFSDEGQTVSGKNVVDVEYFK